MIQDVRGNPSICIVIPLYNEESVLAKNVKTLDSFLKEYNFPYSYNIVLVNNASTDRSGLICDELAECIEAVKVIHLDQKGKGRAVRTAWNQANQDILAFMDADLASDLNYFRQLVDAVVRGGHHMSIGNRLGKDSKVISRRFLRKLASHTYNVIVRNLLNTNVPDHQCGFKVIRRDAYNMIATQLEDNEWFFDTELIVHAAKSGFSIKPVDIVWIDKEDSKVKLGQTSYEMFRAVLNLKNKLDL